GADPIWVTTLLVGLFLLITPVLEPWYVVWMLPLACLTFSSRPTPNWLFSAAWILFSGLVVLTELTYVNPSSHTWITVRAAEYLPLYGGLLLWLVTVLRSWMGPRRVVS